MRRPSWQKQVVQRVEGQEAAAAQKAAVARQPDFQAVIGQVVPESPQEGGVAMRHHDLALNRQAPGSGFC